MARGTLFLIAGPSGAGKDTLLDGARAALAGDARYVFARRVITRPADAGGEDHEAATPQAFDLREREGGFLLAWRAHGLAYGLPMSLAGDLSAGRHVVANISRAVIADAARLYAPVTSIEITAPRALLAERLARRGREDSGGIEARLARGRTPAPAGVPAITVLNDGTPEQGIARLVAALGGAAGGTAQSCCA